MINQLTLIGRIGGDPEIRTLEGGTTIARFSVATSESYKDKAGQWQETTEWHNIVVWRELAERCAGLKKGVLVCVVGKVTYRKYEKDGQQRTITEVVASNVRRLEKQDKQDGLPENIPVPPLPGARAPESKPQTFTPPTVDDGGDLPF